MDLQTIVLLLQSEAHLTPGLLLVPLLGVVGDLLVPQSPGEGGPGLASSRDAGDGDDRPGRCWLGLVPGHGDRHPDWRG